MYLKNTQRISNLCYSATGLQ